MFVIQNPCLYIEGNPKWINIYMPGYLFTAWICKRVSFLILSMYNLFKFFYRLY